MDIAKSVMKDTVEIGVVLTIGFAVGHEIVMGLLKEPSDY